MVLPPASPKIELHVHLEGTVGPRTLLDIARRNGVPLPATDQDGIRNLYRFSDFAGFVQAWITTTDVLRTERDFREVVVAYAEQAAGHGCIYLEGIFSPAERARRGVPWDEIFTGYCDGADEARERFGIEVRLTPDMPRTGGVEPAAETVRHAIRYRDRGVVGVGLGGPESAAPASAFADVFRAARDAGLAAVPHAGESAGADSVRDALDTLGAARIRHGIRASEDPELVVELAERGVVLDVCLTSNVRLGVVPSLAAHPLPHFLEAGMRCSVSTDDPAILDTDLTREYAVVESLGIDPRRVFDDALAGALCDDATRARLASAASA